MAVVGTAYSESRHVGPSGETFTRLGSYVDGAVVSWSPTFAEIGSTGRYRWTYTPATAGQHEWVGESSSGIPVDINFAVVTAAQADPAAALAETASAVDAINARLTVARAAKLDRIGSNAEIVAAGTLADGDRLDIRRGDSSLAADGNAKQWTYGGPPIASATLTLRTFAGTQVLQKAVTLSGTTLTAADITSAETSALSLGTPIYRYEIVATLTGGGTSTLVSGEVWVKD